MPDSTQAENKIISIQGQINEALTKPDCWEQCYRILQEEMERGDLHCEEYHFKKDEFTPEKIIEENKHLWGDPDDKKLVEFVARDRQCSYQEQISSWILFSIFESQRSKAPEKNKNQMSNDFFSFIGKEPGRLRHLFNKAILNNFSLGSIEVFLNNEYAKVSESDKVQIIEEIKRIPAREKNKILIRAIEQGCIALCERLIGNGARIPQKYKILIKDEKQASIDEQDLTIPHSLVDEHPSFKYALLYLASKNGDLESVKCLLDEDEKAIICQNTLKDLVPLHAACVAGHVEIVRVLINAGADVHEPPVMAYCYDTVFGQNYNVKRLNWLNHLLLQKYVLPKYEAEYDKKCEEGLWPVQNLLSTDFLMSLEKKPQKYKDVKNRLIFAFESKYKQINSLSENAQAIEIFSKGFFNWLEQSEFKDDMKSIFERAKNRGHYLYTNAWIERNIEKQDLLKTQFKDLTNDLIDQKHKNKKKKLEKELSDEKLEAMLTDPLNETEFEKMLIVALKNRQVKAYNFLIKYWSEQKIKNNIYDWIKDNSTRKQWYRNHRLYPKLFKKEIEEIKVWIYQTMPNHRLINRQPVVFDESITWVLEHPKKEELVSSSISTVVRILNKALSSAIKSSQADEVVTLFQEIKELCGENENTLYVEALENALSKALKINSSDHSEIKSNNLKIISHIWYLLKEQGKAHDSFTRIKYYHRLDVLEEIILPNLLDDINNGAVNNQNFINQSITGQFALSLALSIEKSNVGATEALLQVMEPLYRDSANDFYIQTLESALYSALTIRIKSEDNETISDNNQIISSIFECLCQIGKGNDAIATILEYGSICVRKHLEFDIKLSHWKGNRGLIKEHYGNNQVCEYLGLDKDLAQKWSPKTIEQFRSLCKDKSHQASIKARYLLTRVIQEQEFGVIEYLLARKLILISYLHICLSAESIEATQAVLKQHPINVRFLHNNTKAQLLRHAISIGDEINAQACLDAGADPNQKDDNKNNAWDYCGNNTKLKLELLKSRINYCLGKAKKLDKPALINLHQARLDFIQQALNLITSPSNTYNLGLFKRTTSQKGRLEIGDIFDKLRLAGGVPDNTDQYIYELAYLFDKKQSNLDALCDITQKYCQHEQPEPAKEKLKRLKAKVQIKLAGIESGGTLTQIAENPLNYAVANKLFSEARDLIKTLPIAELYQDDVEEKGAENSLTPLQVAMMCYAHAQGGDKRAQKDLSNLSKIIIQLLERFHKENNKEENSTLQFEQAVNASISMLQQGETLLHLAAREGSKDAAEFLLRNNPNVNSSYTDYTDEKEVNITPLRLAIENGHYEIVELLLNKKAKINSEDINIDPAKNQIAPLCALIEASLGKNIHEDTINKCISKLKRKQKLEQALAIASISGKAKTVEKFIEKGVNVNFKLPQKPQGDIIRPRKNWSKTTALLLAIQSGETEVAKLLMNKGADPSICDGENKDALIHAIERGNLELVQFMLSEAKIREQVNLNDTIRLPLWHRPITCIRSRSIPLMHALNTDYQDNEKQLKIARYLIGKGAHYQDVKRGDFDIALTVPKNSLINSISKLAKCSELIKKKRPIKELESSFAKISEFADVDIKSQLLREAVKHNHSDAVDFLIRQGGNPSKEDYLGNSAWDYAKNDGRMAIKLLAAAAKRCVPHDACRRKTWLEKQDYVIKILEKSIDKINWLSWACSLFKPECRVISDNARIKTLYEAFIKCNQEAKFEAKIDSLITQLRNTPLDFASIITHLANAQANASVNASAIAELTKSREDQLATQYKTNLSTVR